MIIRNQINIYSIVFILMFLLSITFYFYKKIPLLQNSLHTKEENISLILSTKTDISNVIPNGEVSEPITSTASNPLSDKAAMQEVHSWLESRGHFHHLNNGGQQIADYDNYDIATLKLMADAGDIRAMHSLAHSMELQSQNEKILFKAAAYGSTAALIELGSAIETNYNFRRKSANERKPYELKALAYYQAAELRGDQYGNILERKSLLARYPLDLNQKDIDHIQKQAENIYQKTQEERFKLGLGEFDNNIPESVKLYFNTIK